jgi:uncharacterized protein (TIGR03435 family)
MTSFHLVSNHLWQSTILAVGIAALTVLCRRKHAGVRYVLWLAASLKFLVPFAAFGAVGAAIGSRLAMHVPPPAPAILQSIGDVPFAATTVPDAVPATAAGAVTPHVAAGWPALLLAVWAVGCALVVAAWTVRFVRAWQTMRAATLQDDGREVAILRRLEEVSRVRQPLAVRFSDATIEPGVFGVRRPVLVWPRAMSEHLSDDQIETILVHELTHVRRRDNLTAMAHGVVQAICWFHPLVWWIGARLVDERERACDEAVVSAGRDRQVYAESLLKTCQFCVGAPVTCMAGVTGSDLKRRLTSIMTAAPGARLGVASRVMLAIVVAAVVAVPVINGAARVPQVASTIVLPDPAKRFEAASVRQNASGRQGGSFNSRDAYVGDINRSLREMLLQAFPIQDAQLIGGPKWFDSDHFDVVARADKGASAADRQVMLQNLLIDRFAIKLHVETRSLPIYALVRAREDGRLGPDLHVAGCETYSSGSGPCGSGAPSAEQGGSHMESRDGGGGTMTGVMRPGAGASMMMKGATMPGLANDLSRILKRTVVDRTGLDGRFELTLRYTMPGTPSAADGDATQRAPELFTALQEQLGLKLEATRGPVEVLVIDSAEHPVNDDFVMSPQ